METSASGRAPKRDPEELKRRPEAVASVRRYALVTLLVLAPCFWQTRLQASDLLSHIYNAWLARLVASGRAPGLTIVSQSTNVLFDWLLSGLMEALGPAAAQRIAVALAVLIFFWGAFAFIEAVAGRRPWALAPVIAIMSYGWVFHAGFFNFYLSLGLCFWAMSLIWKPQRRRMAAAVALFAVAWLGHYLPVLWSIAILGYAWLAARIRPAARSRLLALSVVGLIGVHIATRAIMIVQWYRSQVLLTTGADQAFVFDGKYYLCSVGLVLAFSLLFIELVMRSGLRTVVSGIPFQICALSAAIVTIVPTAIAIREWQAAFIAERMSLPLGICVCALLGGVTVGRIPRAAIGAVTLFYFGLLYRDERLLNQFEDRLERAAARIPPGRRVISAIDDPDLRVNALTHMIDRVCLGRCYSYANYEPSKAQFRIRAVAASPLVASTYGDSWDMQSGTYVVKERDLPLYAVTLDDAGHMVIQELHAGERMPAKRWKALPDL
jgi:hypothetical protein